MLGVEITSISDKTLYKWNLGACILHFVQGTFLFVASFTAPGVKDFNKDITTNWLEYDEETNSLVNETETIGTIKIGTVVSILETVLTHFVRICLPYALLRNRQLYFFLCQRWRIYMSSYFLKSI